MLQGLKWPLRGLVLFWPTSSRRLSRSSTWASLLTSFRFSLRGRNRKIVLTTHSDLSHFRRMERRYNAHSQDSNMRTRIVALPAGKRLHEALELNIRETWGRYD
ncbi:hypothetical protein CC85DRAFT_94461 [Cutaneotrichosporon oleaginosum]|uniref:Uncharacterized protein n=1 Tax=Cutaneotrichosporon oleaginosum TaxID=879819 RepID=A0A0J0XM99_9TREE|nr:uncharacterized protein CC85DRAFT_94461 [Cutaneotrichosporon oleaginosum]KLT42260.1 hypothetical protein CC85DRAFT_94461 [Cutaneotrichosporon oleaginosum]TXT11432.1 hypothetical protein COLE_01842 [Cutaneotrichosporon oleaginosum]